jgi:hypothetical protein
MTVHRSVQVGLTANQRILSAARDVTGWILTCPNI